MAEVKDKVVTAESLKTVYDKVETDLTTSATTLTTAINKNKTNIATNKTNIATNTTNIATNATAITKKNNKFGRKSKKFTSIKVSSNYYVELGTFEDAFGISPDDYYIVSYNVIGWAGSGATGNAFSLAKSSDGTALYLLAPLNSVYTSVIVEIWYYAK